jgi:Leucine-rich repeat (LRR) protein
MILVDAQNAALQQLCTLRIEKQVNRFLRGVPDTLRAIGEENHIAYRTTLHDAFYKLYQGTTGSPINTPFYKASLIKRDLVEAHRAVLQQVSTLRTEEEVESFILSIPDILRPIDDEDQLAFRKSLQMALCKLYRDTTDNPINPSIHKAYHVASYFFEQRSASHRVHDTWLKKQHRETLGIVTRFDGTTVAITHIVLPKSVRNIPRKYVGMDLPKLTRLFFAHTKIKTPPALNCPVLTCLSFSHSRLTHLPAMNLPILTHLFLEKTQLTKLPELNLQTLLYLSLKGTQITGLPALNLPALRDLDLSDTQIAGFPAKYNLRSLTHLDLHNTPFTDLTALDLPALLVLILDSTQTTYCSPALAISCPFIFSTKRPVIQYD